MKAALDKGSFGRVALLEVGLRSFFIQAAWNFERMQNLGWAFCMGPALSRLYPDRTRRAQALKRHLEFFNTHPYLAGPILGYAIRTEEKVAAGKGASAAEVTTLKMGMMGTLAALGDNFFWATLRPLVAVLGACFILLAPGMPRWGWTGAVLYLILFNLPHLAIRFLGLFQGYRRGPGIVAFLRQVHAQGLVRWMRLGGLVLAGALLACFDRMAGLGPGTPTSALPALVWLTAAAAILFLLNRKIQPHRIYFAGLLLCLAAAAFRP
jgi:PTS system mannose-specific IID component